MEPRLCFESRNRSCPKRNYPMPVRVTLYIIFGIIIILTVCGNLLVTFSVVYFKQLHTPTNYLIVSLAMSDLLLGVLVMFPQMILIVESCWYFGEFLCKVSLSSNVTMVTASILNLSFISVDRYYAVCQPLLYRRKISGNVALIMIIISWSISVMFGFGMVFLKLNIFGVEEFYYNHVACEGGCILFLSKLSSTLSSVLSFYMPGIILLVVYLKIFLVAHRQFRSIQNAGSVKTSNTRQTKATKTLAIVVGAFLCLWAPFFLCILIHPYISSKISEDLFHTLAWVGHLNSMVNPIIYAFFYSWFRKAFQLLASGNIFKSDMTETKLLTK